METQLVISKALGFGSEESRHLAESLSSEVSRMLVAMMNKLQKRRAAFLFPIPFSLFPALGYFRF